MKNVSRSTAGGGGRRRYDAIVVAALAIILVALWVLSLAGVRARLAMRAWENGDVETAHRLAAMATRQRPDWAEMWLLQARCQEQMGTPCDSALSYARAVLAANEREARRVSAALASGDEADVEDPVAGGQLVALRSEARQAALAAAASCGSVTALANVFEALTAGLPSNPQLRTGLWPGQPEIATGRDTAESLVDALPIAAAPRLRWIEFLWRRGERSAALRAADSLLSADHAVPAAEMWVLGEMLLAAGSSDDAALAFEQALSTDPGWVPAAGSLAGLEPVETPDAIGDWSTRPVPLASAEVDAAVAELRPDSLVLGTNGSVSFAIEVPPTAGRAFLVLSLWGTAANGRYPEVGLSIDAIAEPTFEATDSRLPVAVEIPAGGRVPVTLTFTFNNDWADASGDRNVFFGIPTLYLAPE